MKNTNESITDIFKMFKKEKVYTVEDFFRISTGSPKEQGVKGLILKMVDVMTPDINMKARDQGDARAPSRQLPASSTNATRRERRDGLHRPNPQ